MLPYIAKKTVCLKYMGCTYIIKFMLLHICHKTTVLQEDDIIDH